MIISKRLEDAEFIMSKDELTYFAVIEDFKNASQIHILTYNISKDQNVLLKALKDCEKDTEICIVSNIPDVGNPILEKPMQIRLKEAFHYIKVSCLHKRLRIKQRFIFVFQIMQKLL